MPLQRGDEKVDEARHALRQAKSPVIPAAYECWLQGRARSGWSLPGRQHLDPVEMVGLLPNVVFTAVVRKGQHCRFRHSFVGSHFVDILGRDVTGKFIEHIGWLEMFDDLYRRFTTAVDEKALVYGVTSLRDKGRDLRSYEHLTLPLASDGQTVDLLFGVRCALDGPGIAAPQGYIVVPVAGEMVGETAPLKSG